MGFKSDWGSQMNGIEETKNLKIDFGKLKHIVKNKNDVIPVAVQNSVTGDLLIIAYVNQEALEYSLLSRKATFWSTSRNELWVKGATSGDELEIVEIRINCDQNSLLYIVIPKNKNACHTNRKTCYYRKVKSNELEFIHE